MTLPTGENAASVEDRDPAPFCDAFTLARIAGHSSITITQRYCHPQADAVEGAFSKFGNAGVMQLQSDSTKTASNEVSHG